MTFDPAGTRFGVARLGEALQAADALPPEQIISRLHEAVAVFSGGMKQQNDLTALVIQRPA